MSLEVGIVGLPNVGKSTLFSALTRVKADTENYPFCTIEPNQGRVFVPDERVEKLSQLNQSKQKFLTTLDFSDIAAETVERIARTKLHCRLTNSKTRTRRHDRRY